MQFFIWYAYLKACLIDLFRTLFGYCAFCGSKGTEVIHLDVMEKDIVVCDDCFEEQLEIMFYRERGDTYGEE